MMKKEFFSNLNHCAIYEKEIGLKATYFDKLYERSKRNFQIKGKL